MKRINSIIIIILFPAICYSYQILGIGDSIMDGVGGATDGPLPTLSGYLSLTYYNAGVSGSCTNTGNTNIASWLSTYGPVSRCYDNYGINDIRTWSVTCEVDLTTWLTYKANIKNACVSAEATYYAMQVTPEKGCTYDGGNDPSGTIKLWNAYLEDWCVSNSVNLCPTFQDMADSTTDDAMNTSYTADKIHPNAGGDVVYGYLMYNAGVPNRKRDWGSSSYPTMGHESLSWWVITGTGSVTGGSTDGVTGYNDGGTLSLSQSAYAVSNVLSVLVPSGNQVSISNTLTQGAVSVSYRTSDTNFTRANTGISWTSYTGAFSMPSGHYFIQIKLTNSDATTALIDVITLDWSGSAPSSAAISGCSLHGVGYAH